MGAADDDDREKWLSANQQRVDDPQRERVYRAQSATIAGRGEPRDLQTVEDVRRLIEAAVRDLGVGAVAVAEVPRAPRDAPISAAECDPEGRVIFIEAADEHGAIHSLLAFHELAHVLTPTPDEPHGATFARTFLDLVDRYRPGYSTELRMQFLRRAVRAAPGPGKWARPASILNLNELAAIERGDELYRRIAGLEDLLGPPTR